ncbi:MAG: alpha/beta hydrolase [Gammaproteobacteria bacterium]
MRGISQLVQWKFMRKTLRGTVSFVVLVLILIPIAGMKANDEWDALVESDYEAQALAVNEGELEFLSELPDKLPPVLQNRFTISAQSLKDGWVDMVQCHERLDPVAKAQVLYYPRRTRNIEILSSNNIQRSWVENNSVQLENIGANATLCIHAEVKSLYSNFNGSYSMRNGPFLRKFLDGYYPMRVTMDVTFPQGKLSFEAINPQAQNGFDVQFEENKMNIEALFVGELEIEVYFTDLTGSSEEG